MANAAGGSHLAATRRFLYEQVELPISHFSALVALDSPAQRDRIRLPIPAWMEELHLDSDQLLPLSPEPADPNRLLHETAVGMSVIFHSFYQFANAAAWIRTLSNSKPNPFTELKRHLTTISRTLQAQVSIPGLKQVLAGLVGSNREEFATRVLKLIASWAWPDDNEGLPAVPNTPGDMPANVRALIHPTAFAAFSMMGDNAVYLAFLIIMMLSGGYTSQQYLLWRGSMAHTACYREHEAAGYGAEQFDRIYDIWLEVQAHAVPETGMADYNHWRLRARVFTLAYAMRNLVTATVEYAAMLGMPATRDLQMDTDYDLSLGGLVTYLQSKTASFSVLCQGIPVPSRHHTPSASTPASGATQHSESATASNQADASKLAGRQGFEFVTKQVQRKGSKYCIPTLTAGQLQWEDWFEVLRATPSKFQLSDEQVIIAATDHLPSRHILISTWEDHCKDLRALGHPVTLDAFVAHAKKRLFATPQVKQQACRWFQQILQSPEKHAEDCADMADLTERVLRRLFPRPDTEEILNLTWWQSAQGHYSMLTKLRDTMPNMAGQPSALVLAWRKYQFDATAVYNEYLKRELHLDRAESDALSQQYFQHIHAHLRSAHDMYEATRAVTDLFHMNTSTPVGPSTAVTLPTSAIQTEQTCYQMHSAMSPPVDPRRPGPNGHKGRNGKHSQGRNAVHELVANPYGARRARDSADTPLPTSRATRHQPQPPGEMAQHQRPVTPALPGDHASPDVVMVSEEEHTCHAADKPGAGKRSKVTTYGPGDYYLIEANAPPAASLVKLAQLGRVAVDMNQMLSRMQHQHCPLCDGPRHHKGPNGCPSLQAAQNQQALADAFKARQQWFKAVRAAGTIEKACREHHIQVQLPRKQVPNNLRIRVI